ncbi:MAG: nucleotide disphospho-sugar-binding domain-containing protein [Polyangiales bacterium]
MIGGDRVLVLGVALGLGEESALLGAACALHEAGHDVTLAATPRLAARARATKLRAVAIGPDLAPGEPSYWDTVFETLLDVHRGPRRWLNDAVAPLEAAWLAGCTDIARDADVILAGSLAPFAPAVARAAGIPWVRLARAPDGLGPEAPHELVHWLGAHAAHAAAKLPKATRELVARAQRALAARMRDAGPAPTLRLAAFSPALALACQEGPSAVAQIGALAHDDARPLDPALADFVGAGTPPVLLTLGSTPSVYRPGAIHDAFAEALARAPRTRGVLVVADELVDTLRPRFESDTLRVAGYTPYGLLMPRCQAVVHHGGAGAVAHALAAGIPSLVVGHASYQRTHAGLLAGLGIGRALAPSAVSVTSLAEALRGLRDDDALRARAREVGERVRAENPSAALVAALRSAVARTPAQPSGFAAASGSRPVSTRISL